MPNNRRWTEEEDALVLDAAREAHSQGRHDGHVFLNRYAEVAKAIGRTENAVQLRAQRIGASASLGWERACP